MLATHDLSITIAKKIICRHLNWTLKPHDIWGILGPNGSGKTTFLLTLAGLLQPAAGDIFLFEKKISQLKRREIAKKIGIIFQETPTDLFQQTVFEYCASGRYPHSHAFYSDHLEDINIIEQALIHMDLHHLNHQLVRTLSGGEHKRLHIATLLAQTPRIYLLDEPMNHLDIRYQIQVLEHFKKLSRQGVAGIVMSLHNLRLAKQYCDKIILLLGGGEFLLGTPQELLTQDYIQQVYQCRLSKEYLQIF